MKIKDLREKTEEEKKVEIRKLPVRGTWDFSTGT